MAKSDEIKKKIKKIKIKKNKIKKKKVSTKCSYINCNGHNCGIKNILSSYILVKEIVNGSIVVYPAHLNYSGFEVINPSGLIRQMSIDKMRNYQIYIDNMSNIDKNILMTKEETLISFHT